MTVGPSGDISGTDLRGVGFGELHLVQLHVHAAAVVERLHQVRSGQLAGNLYNNRDEKPTWALFSLVCAMQYRRRPSTWQGMCISLGVKRATAGRRNSSVDRHVAVSRLAG